MSIAISVLIIIINTIVLYAVTSKHNLVVDDIRWHDKVKKGFYSKPKPRPFWNQIKYRLYSGATFTKKDQVNYKIEHWFRIFLHTLTSVLIYFVFGKNNISLVAALLYSCNPANNQTSLWLNGRRYIVNIILLLLMMLYSPWAFILYPLTLAFQVNVIFAPVLLGVWGVALMPLLLLYGYNRFKHKVKGRMQNITNEDMNSFKPKRLIVIIKSYGHYFFKMILPGRIFCIYPKLYYWGMTDEGNKDAYAFNLMFWQGALSVILSGLGLYYFKGPHFYMWLFMCLSILQWCNIIPAVQGLADRYQNVPNIFMMYFISLLAYKYLGVYAPVLITGLIVHYVIYLQDSFRMYKHINDFYDYHIFYDPAGTACRHYKAKWFINIGDPMGAWELVRVGLAYKPNDYKLLYAASVCLMMMRDAQSAMAYAKKAEQNIYFGQKDRAKVALDQIRSHINGMFVLEEHKKIVAGTSKLSGDKRNQIKELYEKHYKKMENDKKITDKYFKDDETVHQAGHP